MWWRWRAVNRNAANKDIEWKEFCWKISAPSSPNSIDQARQIIITHRALNNSFLFRKRLLSFVLAHKTRESKHNKKSIFSFHFQSKSCKPKAKIVHCLGSVQYSTSCNFCCTSSIHFKPSRAERVLQ